MTMTIGYIVVDRMRCRPLGMLTTAADRAGCAASQMPPRRAEQLSDASTAIQ